MEWKIEYDLLVSNYAVRSEELYYKLMNEEVTEDEFSSLKNDLMSQHEIDIKNLVNLHFRK